MAFKVKRLEDIEREKSEEKREKLKRQITEDARDVIEGVFGGPKKPNYKKTPMDIFWVITKWIFFIILFVFFVNFILGNIWLLKFFIKDLFGIG
ncbi:hypothetical protein J4221_00915 [Candidatus Pacearchaeota archaeon]|nr:hypothetical protein [Candidatus Pacearchaeota archaeon]